MYCHNCIGTPLGWQEAVIEDSGIGCSIVRNSQKVGPDSRFKFVNTAVFFGKVLTKNVNSRAFFCWVFTKTISAKCAGFWFVLHLDQLNPHSFPFQKSNQSLHIGFLVVV